MSRVVQAHMSCSSSVSHVMRQDASSSGRSKRRLARIARVQRRIVFDLLGSMDYSMSDPIELADDKGLQYVLSKKFEDMDSVFEIELWVFPTEFPRVASSTTGHREIVVDSERKWISYVLNAVQPVFKVSMKKTLEDVLDTMSEADFAMGPDDLAVFASPSNEPGEAMIDEEPKLPPVVAIPDDESKPQPVVVIPDDSSSQDSQSTEDSQSSLDY